ncbi:unnamed protein product [Pedinophyceae sp. YPF-701]|nr:unnamed protein product [Pedinophyceae sp. YPF-701]
MSGKKADINAIWAQLQKSAAPKARREANPAIPTEAPHIAPRAPPAGSAAQPAASDTAMAEPSDAAVPVVSWDPSTAGSSEEERDKYVASMQRDVNCMSDPDRATRTGGALRVAARLLGRDTAAGKPSPALLQALVCGPLLKPLVRLLEDPAEKCRSLALEVFLECARNAPDVPALLAPLVPALARRAGDVPVREPSEELRLTILTLVAELLPRGGGPQHMSGFASQWASLLCRGAEDAFHESKKAACAAVRLLVDAVGAEGVSPLRSDLAKSVLTCVGHQHHRVRSRAVDALDALVCASCPIDALREVIAPGMEPLLSDHTASVRLRALRALSGWLGFVDAPGAAPPDIAPDVLRARMPLLLPYVLLLVTDTAAPEVASAALAAVEGVGAVYCARVLASESEGGVADVEEEAEREAAGLDAAAAAPLLPAPFTGLPGRDAERTVRAVLDAVLPSTLRQMREWTADLRAGAARKLLATCTFARGGLVRHLAALESGLATAAGDVDEEVAQIAIKASHVVGAMVQPKHWLPICLDAVSGARLVPGQRASGLAVLSGHLHAAHRAGRALDADLTRTLVSGLCAEDVRGCEDGAVRHQLVAATHNAIAAIGAGCKEVSRELFHVLLQMRASGSASDPRLVEVAGAATEALARACELPGADAVASLHAPGLLRDVCKSDDTWTKSSPDFLGFCALLRLCPSQTLSDLMPGIAATAGPLLDPTNEERDPAMRLALLQLLEELIDAEATAPAFGGRNAPGVLLRLLLPPMLWKVGKVAAAVRYAAVVCVATFLRRRLATAAQLIEVLAVPNVLTMMHGVMEEDYYQDTRHTACHLMLHLLESCGAELTYEQLRAIYPELMKRMDDSNDGVRCAAAAAVGAFFRTTRAAFDKTNAGYFVAGILVHLDDQDAGVQRAVGEALAEAARAHPGVVLAEVEKVRERFRAQSQLDKLVAVAQGASG